MLQVMLLTLIAMQSALWCCRLVMLPWPLMLQRLQMYFPVLSKGCLAFAFRFVQGCSHFTCTGFQVIGTCSAVHWTNDKLTADVQLQLDCCPVHSCFHNTAHKCICVAVPVK